MHLPADGTRGRRRRRDRALRLPAPRRPLVLTELLGGATLDRVAAVTTALVRRRTRARPMSAEPAAFPTVVDFDAAGADPPFDYPEYGSTRLRAPKEPLVIVPHTLSELTGPVYGDAALGELDNDLTRQHAGAPLGERIIVTGRVLGATASRCAGSSSRSGRRTPRAGTGTTSTRTTRRSTRTSPAPAVPDRRRRPVPVRHDQARRVPVGEPSERVAAESHPLLALRARFHRAARDADVLPGRPAVRPRPDLPVDPRRARPRAPGQPASTSR